MKYEYRHVLYRLGEIDDGLDQMAAAWWRVHTFIATDQGKFIVLYEREKET